MRNLDWLARRSEPVTSCQKKACDVVEARKASGIVSGVLRNLVRVLVEDEKSRSTRMNG